MFSFVGFELSLPVSELYKSINSRYFQIDCQKSNKRIENQLKPTRYVIEVEHTRKIHKVFEQSSSKSS
jgi:uncharacterized protein with ACT and thioredoxin-like domain